MFLVAVLAVATALPGTASAHPLLVGTWRGELPPGAPTIYEFGPGEYVGGGMWRGPFTVTISGCVISFGDYYLRVYDGPNAVIALRDGLRLSSRVGIVDLTAGTLDYMGIVYRR
jgi:hypothetical protein